MFDFFHKELTLGSASQMEVEPFDFNMICGNLIFTQTEIEPNRHKYLRKYYTHEDMEQLTYSDLSQYA